MDSNSITPVRLFTAARVSLLFGAVGSLALFLYAGRNKHPGILVVVLFAMWVVSPFLVLGIAEQVSNHWSDLTRRVLRVVTLLVTLASLAIYGMVALGPLSPRMVPIFVMVPPLSWLLIALALSSAGMITKQK